MEVSTQKFLTPSTWTWYIGLSILITQIAVIIYLIPPMLAAIFAGLGIFFYIMEIEMHPILSRLMYKRQSQHVIGQIKSEQAGSKKIVITAHIDTARADYPHHPQRVTSFRKLAIMNMIILIFIFITYFIGALLDFSNISPLQFKIEWLFSLLLVISTLYSSFLLVLREWRYEVVPGANDNASGVSVALEMMANCAKNPLQETEVIVVFTGSEEVNCYGMIEFLKKQGGDL